MIFPTVQIERDTTTRLNFESVEFKNKKEISSSSEFSNAQLFSQGGEREENLGVAGRGDQSNPLPTKFQSKSHNL